MAEATTVNIFGHELTIDEETRNSWEMFDLVCKIGTEFDQTKLPLAFELIELCTGVDKEALVEMCGGKKAPFRNVLESVNTLLTAIVPKN